MKNQSGAIKTNLELYRVVMGGSGGYRRLTGGSDDFSWHTNTQTLHHNIYITRARPRAQYWSTVTTVGPAQRLLSPLFSWQRFSTNQNHFEILFFLDNYLSMKSFAVPNISWSSTCHGSICSSICPTQSWIHGTAQVFDHHHHHFDHYCHHHYSQSWLHGTAQVLFTIIITVDITIFLIVTIIIDPTMDSWHTSGRLAPLSPFLS